MKKAFVFRTALIEEDDAVGFRVVEGAVLRGAAAARAAVHDDDGLAVGVAALFVVDLHV
jgi:hypothetical protein